MILWVFIEFFGVKIVITDIYRYFTDIFFRNSSTSACAPQSRFFGVKSAILPIFPLIDFPLFFLLGANQKPIFRQYIGPKKRFFVPYSQLIRLGGMGQRTVCSQSSLVMTFWKVGGSS